MEIGRRNCWNFLLGAKAIISTGFKQCKISGCVGLVLDFITKWWRDVLQRKPVVCVIYNFSVIKCVFVYVYNLC